MYGLPQLLYGAAGQNAERFWPRPYLTISSSTIIVPSRQSDSEVFFCYLVFCLLRVAGWVLGGAGGVFVFFCTGIIVFTFPAQRVLVLHVFYKEARAAKKMREFTAVIANSTEYGGEILYFLCLVHSGLCYVLLARSTFLLRTIYFLLLYSALLLLFCGWRYVYDLFCRLDLQHGSIWLRVVIH